MITYPPPSRREANKNPIFGAQYTAKQEFIVYLTNRSKEIQAARLHTSFGSFLLCKEKSIVSPFYKRDLKMLRRRKNGEAMAPPFDILLFQI